MRRSLAALVVLVPAAALADSDSVVTLGLGSHTIVARTAGATALHGDRLGMGQGFSARARFLWVFGAEFSYDLVSARAQPEVNVPAPTFKLSGLLYLIPHRSFSLYLVGGLGSTDLGDLTSPTGSTTSYHAGAGLEVGLTDHWTVSADFRVNLPNYGQVMLRGKQEAAIGQVPSLSSYYGFDTWQVNVGLRYYL